MAQFRKKCLIVDDDPIVAEFIRFALGERAEFVTVEKGGDALRVARTHSFDAAFVDLNLPDRPGHEVIRELREMLPDLPVVVVSSTQEIRDAVTAFRLGALDFLQKPLDSALVQQVFKKCTGQRELERAGQILRDTTAVTSRLFVGEDPKIEELRQDLQRLKGSELDALVVAESGCGKELVARTLHSQEGDRTRPFITLNCSAIPRELMESILFGHEKGSFTGADRKQLGKFELAHNGDIFLDEIGTLPLDLQAKLLRVLQEREIEPVGAGITKKLNFRVIAATNEDLASLVNEGKFRKDLYFRLNKVILRVPPLRERRQDIPVLVKHFLGKEKFIGRKKTLEPEALEKLIAYDWPGNVRELENILENLSFTARGESITGSDIDRLGLRNEIQTPESEKESLNETLIESAPGTLDEKLRRYERSLLMAALGSFKKKQDAALYLGLDRKALFRKVKSHGLS